MYNLTFTNIKKSTKKSEKMFTWTFIEGKQYTNVASELLSLHLQKNYNPTSGLDNLKYQYISYGLVRPVKNYQAI